MTVLAALMAGVVGTSLAAASSASAKVTAEGCNSNSMRIVRGASAQCFTWDGVQGGTSAGSYLLVNDWYNTVRAGQYRLTVSWHDTVTGQWFAPSITAGQESNQPSSNSVLYSITFNSR
ncbi:hypothetical protein [Kitasatospora sp. NPDC087271]|uniref:hypothetical protein n=1 Tax=Kitasatospora sp. NPDC087271 TaxID=3364067 RepID=UPI0037FB380C